MIRNFPLDYMHLICLGVVKKLIVSLWLGGKPGIKLSHHQVKTSSKSLVNHSSQIPSEFSRKPRSLDDAKRWKATEFRLFLFYLGPVVLQPVLDQDKYVHFITLHVALSFLSNSKFANHYEYAESLLKYFVETFMTLYGSENVSHNIHNLLHLCDDVKYLGPIDQFSAFPFENHMQKLKKLVRKGEKPLEQISRRIYEQERNFNNPQNCSQTQYPQPSIEHSEGPLFSNVINSKQYKKVEFSNYVLRTSEADNCCYLQNNSVIIIKKFIAHEGEMKIIERKFINLENLYTSPCESSQLGIFISSTPGPLQLWPLSQVAYKCMKLKLNHTFITFPLLHLQ
nr:uncharacterized protein LOC111503073 isoform X1 [Leptinotarsa decemlineata]